MKQTPMIYKGDLTDRWYVATKYKVVGQAFMATEKFDITDQIEEIIRRSKESRRAPKGGGSCTPAVPPQEALK